MTTTTDLNSIALANVAARKDDHPHGFTPNPDATAADFEVGQVVSIYSRGYYRSGVVEKVGRKNVTVLYFTETSVREGTERLLRTRAKSDAQLAYEADEQAKHARRNWEYKARRATEELPEDATRWGVKAQAEAAEYIAANPDVEVVVAEARASHLAWLERSRQLARDGRLEEFSNDTRKSDSFDKIGVRS